MFYKKLRYPNNRYNSHRCRFFYNFSMWYNRFDSQHHSPSIIVPLSIIPSLHNVRNQISYIHLQEYKEPYHHYILNMLQNRFYMFYNYRLYTYMECMTYFQLTICDIYRYILHRKIHWHHIMNILDNHRGFFSILRLFIQKVLLMYSLLSRRYICQKCQANKFYNCQYCRF